MSEEAKYRNTLLCICTYVRSTHLGVPRCNMQIYTCMSISYVDIESLCIYIYLYLFICIMNIFNILHAHVVVMYIQKVRSEHTC